MTADLPPMGWNSWDCYGTTVTEDEVLANAEFVAAKLLPHGWDTVVVDMQWHEPTARSHGFNADAPLELDEHGYPAPVTARFPSAADGAGFAPLAARVHDLGLRFGVHVMRGVPRIAVRRRLPVEGTPYTADQIADTTSDCDWCTDNWGIDHDHPGGQAYYDGLLRRFAAWGVDLVKADDMLGPFHAAEIDAFSAALRSCGRDMVLSLSPGRALSLAHADRLASVADMWRISEDLWDRWPDLYGQFERLARWSPVVGPGAWPDADMLPLGRIGIRSEIGVDRHCQLTRDEQRTMMTLWCIARSPLMVGGDLPTSDPRTIDLLTNDAVLDMTRHSTGGRQVLRDAGLVVWTAESTDRPGRYVAVFAVEDAPVRRELPLSDVGWTGPATASDLWGGASSEHERTLPVDLAAHGCTAWHLRG